MATNRSTARLVRFAIFALGLLACGYILSTGSSFSTGPSTAQTAANVDKAAGNVDKAAVPANEASVPAAAKPKTNENVASNGERMKATFVTLARNSDLNSLLGSIRQVEDRFNSKFHYDWVFLNDQPFSDEFKAATSAIVSGTTKYGLIPEEQWSFPDWIDKEKAALAREQMKEQKVIYGDSIPYRHMCRYESGFFWRHPLMDEYEYYWRVEPDIKIYCDIDYDIFKWMKDNNKKYSFTITLPEYKATIPTLWDTTKQFIKENPQFLNDNNLMEWISDDKGETYNGCHFWSNFEIASLDVWRSEAYRKYFDHLDKAGGFFYERWGDAPVHSIAAALFLPRDTVHFFNDVGYYHVPFHNCPVDPEVRLAKKCVCNPQEDFSWKGYSCTAKFHTINNVPRLKGWENFAD
ncbi:glycosyl transferase [Hyphopichia burtonii NRRL Y-1933]|uniref:Glycosyl transferase n=1 Tax=Hyphopichia burtonii NRRL Y-1933 TaxID=984485 RepID=A0A1E4RQU1_9ASCO|nr:glycosyl transferase [Hyphopichia burtonii NRRL Y-1933]ODV69435.1 glycosyl transferase [Hyphopichia burtonii NRRL Y-1933]